MKGRRNLISGVIVALVIVAVAAVGLSQFRGSSGANPTPTPSTKNKVSTRSIVSAEGTIVPFKQARLAFKMVGRVTELLVQAGDSVTAGQPLARQNTRDLANAVRQAEATLQLAKAQLAKVQAGARPEEVAQAEAGVTAARAGLASAQGALAAARANLNKLQAGATQRQLEIAAQQWELAKNRLFGAQARRDAVGGMREDPLLSQSYQRGNYEAAQAEVQQAEQGVEIARLQYEDLKAGARPEDVAAAQAAVQQAIGQVQAAQAQVDLAVSRLDLVKAGARAEDMAVAQAGVAQAEAALATAQAALEDATLVAPFAGTIGGVSVEVGELASPQVPILTLGDLSRLQVETKDLSEVDVAQVKVGQPVEVSVDALPDQKFKGKVAQIAPQAVERRGDMVYSVKIELDQGTEAGLRWGMTAFVDISVK